MSDIESGGALIESAWDLSTNRLAPRSKLRAAASGPLVATPLKVDFRLRFRISRPAGWVARIQRAAQPIAVAGLRPAPIMRVERVAVRRPCRRLVCACGQSSIALSSNVTSPL